MADEVDIAQEKSDLFFDVAQKNRKANQPMILATGQCLYCGEPLDDGLRWCGAECRDCWEREQKKR